MRGRPRLPRPSGPARPRRAAMGTLMRTVRAPCPARGRRPQWVRTPSSWLPRPRPNTIPVALGSKESDARGVLLASRLPEPLLAAWGGAVKAPCERPINRVSMQSGQSETFPGPKSGSPHWELPSTLDNPAGFGTIEPTSGKLVFLSLTISPRSTASSGPWRRVRSHFRSSSADGWALHGTRCCG